MESNNGVIILSPVFATSSNKGDTSSALLPADAPKLPIAVIISKASFKSFPWLMNLADASVIWPILNEVISEYQLNFSMASLTCLIASSSEMPLAVNWAIIVPVALVTSPNCCHPEETLSIVNDFANSIPKLTSLFEIFEIAVITKISHAEKVSFVFSNPAIRGFILMELTLWLTELATPEKFREDFNFWIVDILFLVFFSKSLLSNRISTTRSSTNVLIVLLTPSIFYL